MRHADKSAFTGITEKLARFALDYSKNVRFARPTLPEELTDRDQDNWDPLLAIAQCAGPVWVQRATEAAIKLSNHGKSSTSISNGLLSDIRDIFVNKQVDKFSSEGLINELIQDKEKPWATYNKGNQLTPSQLAKQLAPYGIKSKTVRHGSKTPKGYDEAQFSDVFARYLDTP